MPLHLEPLEVSEVLQDVHSVLIVPCPICPPVSLATDNDSRFLDIFRAGFKTPAFEDYVRQLRDDLEQRGIRTAVFSSRLPCPAMCLWTKMQRNRLARRASDFEAVLVLGCESGRVTATQALEGRDCLVVLGMGMRGITNATVAFPSPARIEFRNVTRVQAQGPS
jgi:hypothetical protein